MADPRPVVRGTVAMGERAAAAAFPDGVLVVDKPEGPTSHDVVAAARRALGVSRIGHTGTLDPLATGVLPLVVGRATRLAQFLTASAKEYEAVVRFGVTSDTYDAAGTLVAVSGRRPDRAALDAALRKFRGVFPQTPPAFSARRVGGARAYTVARRGGSAPGLEDRPVTVDRLDVTAFDGETASLSMRVSPGFYVRSLAHDLGQALGTGAVLERLRRTRAGDFDLSDAVTLGELVERGPAVADRTIGVDRLLPGVPAARLTPAGVRRVTHGLEVGPSDLESPLPEAQPLCRLLDAGGRLVALAKPSQTQGLLHASVVFG